MRDELSGKIVEMKEGMQNLSQVGILSKSKGEEESDELYKGFMEFRKKGYWKEKSEKSENVRKFLSKMHRMRKEIDHEHEKH